MAGQVIRDDGGSGVVVDELETLLFLNALNGRFGVDFLGFNPAQMRAKLKAYVAATGAESISALQGRALRDDAVGADVVRALNRSCASSPGDMFRLMALRCAILPILRSSPWPAVWLADCADVRVPVLLLALLKEEDLLERTRLFVTSGSEHALEEMKALELSVGEVQALQKMHHSSGGRAKLTGYLRERDGKLIFRPELRASVSWHVHHLATDASFREFQVIIAPRSLAEYGDVLCSRALRLFSESLCQFGILQLDDVHCRGVLLSDKQLEPVLREYGLYRRVT